MFLFSRYDWKLVICFLFSKLYARLRNVKSLYLKAITNFVNRKVFFLLLSEKKTEINVLKSFLFISRLFFKKSLITVNRNVTEEITVMNVKPLIKFNWHWTVNMVSNYPLKVFPSHNPCTSSIGVKETTNLKQLPFCMHMVNSTWC